MFACSTRQQHEMAFDLYHYLAKDMEYTWKSTTTTTTKIASAAATTTTTTTTTTEIEYTWK